MKHLLATTTILALSAGFAAAEVTLSGDARMGIISPFGGGDTAFTSRARVKFSMSGETDGGLAFGASFRAHNAGDAANGESGEVYISGAFGKLSMGDNDSAAQATVGQVDGVGLTGLGDLNEIAYIGDGSPSALYTHAVGGMSFALSLGQLDNGNDEMSVAAAYSMDGYKFSIGYEEGFSVVETGLAFGIVPWDTFNMTSQVTLGADATFGAITVKARYATADGTEAVWNDATTRDQIALSATYTMDALSLTAFVAQSDLSGDPSEGEETDRYGIGASYDLGGGASVVGGYSSIDGTTCDGFFCDSWSDSAFDLGLSFSF